MVLEIRDIKIRDLYRAPELILFKTTVTQSTHAVSNRQLIDKLCVCTQI